MVSAQAVGQQFGESAHGAVLQGFHGAFVALHDRGCLGDRVTLDEPEDDALALVVAQVGDAAQQFVAGAPADDLLFGAGGRVGVVVAGSGVADLVGDDLESETADEVVQDQVPGEVVNQAPTSRPW